MSLLMSLKHSGRISIIIAVLCVALLIATLVGVFAEDSVSADAAAPGEAKFVGSDACKMCHSKLYENWSASAHSKLLPTEGLEDDKKGCEACHGPASLHVSAPTKVKPISLKAMKGVDVAALCGSCHIGPSDSKTPKEWQKLDAKYWHRSEHFGKDVSCNSCHAVHSTSTKLLKEPASDICVSCHAGVLNDASGKKAAYTHTPVAAKQCMMCHQPHGSSRRHLVVPNIQSTCVGCHKADAGLKAKHSGYDVASSDCTSCHDTHSHDKAGALLKSKQHGPFKAKNCGICHKPADSAEGLALTKPEKELCVSCHSKEMGSMPSAHKPVKEGMCTACHSPHASNSESGLLKDKVAYACFTCHSKVENSVNAKFKHKAMEGLNCLQCHKPHSSPEDGLLKKASIDLCKDCHKPHLHPYGTRPDGSEVVDPTTKKMLVCASCHEPHGSQWEHLTKDNYERELCIRCHKEGMHG